MKTVLHFFMLIILLPLMLGCERKKLSYNELEAYVADPTNGFLQQVEKGSYRISVQYLPSELIAYRDAKNASNTAFSETYVDSIQQLYADNEYFKMSISAKGISLEETGIDPIALQKYFNQFALGDCQAVTVNSEVLKPVAVVYSPLLRDPASTIVLLVFKYPSTLTSPIVKLAFRDSLLGFGDMSFDFNHNDLQNRPVLLH